MGSFCGLIWKLVSAYCFLFTKDALGGGCLLCPLCPLCPLQTWVSSCLWDLSRLWIRHRDEQRRHLELFRWDRKASIGFPRRNGAVQSESSEMSPCVPFLPLSWTECQDTPLNSSTPFLLPSLRGYRQSLIFLWKWSKMSYFVLGTIEHKEREGTQHLINRWAPIKRTGSRKVVHVLQGFPHFVLSLAIGWILCPLEVGAFVLLMK